MGCDIIRVAQVLQQSFSFVPKSECLLVCCHRPDVSFVLNVFPRASMCVSIMGAVVVVYMLDLYASPARSVCPRNTLLALLALFLCRALVAWVGLVLLRLLRFTWWKPRLPFLHVSSLGVL